MKRIILLILALLVLTSCEYSYDDSIKPGQKFLFYEYRSDIDNPFLGDTIKILDIKDGYVLFEDFPKDRFSEKSSTEETYFRMRIKPIERKVYEKIY